MPQCPDERPVCAICCEDISAETELARPSVCQHKFCRPCLERLCRSSPDSRRCPLDRKWFANICVLRAGKEAIYDAASMEELDRIFASPAQPASLGCLLLAMLWASPNWLLALHIVTFGGVYWYTEGIADWKLYIWQSVAFYCCLVPVKFFGLGISVYALVCFRLIVYCSQQFPQAFARNNDWTPERALLWFTGVLICLILPAVLFPVYTLAQIYCLLACQLMTCGVQITLCANLGQRYASWSLLFSSIMMAPALCLISDLTLLHLIYYCALAVYFAAAANAATNNSGQQRLLFHNVGLLLSKLVCYVSPSVLFGFSPWAVLYTVCLLTYIAGFCISNILPRLGSTVPLVLAVNMLVVGILIPWQLFGLLTYLGCLIPVFASCYLTDKCVERMIPLANFPLLLFLLQFATLGVLLPALIF